MNYYNVKVYATWYDKHNNQIAVKDWHYGSFNSVSMESLKKQIKDEGVANATTSLIVITKQGKVVREEDFYL